MPVTYDFIMQSNLTIFCERIRTTDYTDAISYNLDTNWSITLNSPESVFPIIKIKIKHAFSKIIFTFLCVIDRDDTKKFRKLYNPQCYNNEKLRKPCNFNNYSTTFFLPFLPQLAVQIHSEIVWQNRSSCVLFICMSNASAFELLSGSSKQFDAFENLVIAV